MSMSECTGTVKAMASDVSLDLEVAETLIHRSEQFNGEHRSLLYRKQELLPVHLDQPTRCFRNGGAETAVIRRDQGTCAEDMPGGDHFVALHALVGQPVEANRSLQHPEHRRAAVTGGEDHITSGEAVGLALGGEGSHGVECVHGKEETSDLDVAHPR